MKDLSNHSDNTLISVQNIGKEFPLFDRPQERVKYYLFPFLQKNHKHKFRALENVSFEVKRGEVVGIIGRNGSGKSTLLQVIAGVMHPTTGTLQSKGRIAALLELGGGFNPEFSGRENVFINGAFLGFSKDQLLERYEEIVSFADIGEFIDQPVKTYSSGMFVRLAFSVQALLSPDILIVDEALAVGDASFQRKCFRRIEELRDQGCAILFVSHDPNIITHLCSRAILLDGGHKVEEGPPSEICDHYQKLLFGEELTSPVEVYGDGKAEIQDVWFENFSKEKIASVKSNDVFFLCYKVKFYEPIENPCFGMRIKNVQGAVISSTNTKMMMKETGRYKKGDEFILRWKLNLKLSPGYYFFSCGVSYADDIRFLCRKVDALKLTVLGAVRNAAFADIVEDVFIKPVNQNLKV